MKIDLISSGSGGASLPYTSRVSLLTQTGTSVPTEILLENGAGISLTWTRLSAGMYRATYGSAVDLSKIALRIGNAYQYSEMIGVIINSTTTTFQLAIEGDNLGGVDDSLENTMLEIRVYS
jgi:hypothetical protein